jgi:cellulose synthase/poly-beta-1,6-N-acetylglucosamine synthase-like glycosyltransferase
LRPETNIEFNRETAPTLHLGPIESVPKVLGFADDKKTFEKSVAGKLVLRLIPLFIIFSLMAILLGKTTIDSTFFVYTYGILVTAVPLATFLFVFTNYKDPALVANNGGLAVEKDDFLVSCLVAVYNEENIIEQCIRSFVDSDYENKEIIFINDASTDATAQILDKYRTLGLINVFHLSENIGKKRALAEGMLRARGDIFLFSDSDSVLAPDAITKVVSAFHADETIGAVSGHCRAMNADANLITKIQDSWYEGQFSIRKAFESIFGCVTCVSGPLAAFRRESIYNLIPAWENDAFLGQEFKFATDRTLTGFVLGSNAIGEKLKRKYKDSLFVKQVDYPCRDWKVVYSKSARVWTAVPDSFRRLIKQQIRWKKTAAAGVGLLFTRFVRTGRPVYSL